MSSEQELKPCPEYAWQPIETAPKDGSEIMLVCATAYSPTAFEGWWDDGWKHYSRDGSHGEKFSHDGGTKWFPTHWQPKPAWNTRAEPRPSSALDEFRSSLAVAREAVEELAVDGAQVGVVYPEPRPAPDDAGEGVSLLISELQKAELIRTDLSYSSVRIALHEIFDRTNRDVVPKDVVELVSAARVIAFDEDRSPETYRRLDRATEAFADRVRWEDEPDIPSEEIAALKRLADRDAVIEEWQLVEQIVAEEGNAVTIFCENPEGTGPDNHAVEVCGDLTDWKDRRFYGATKLAALQAASRAMKGEG